MDIDGFWVLIERSAGRAAAPDARLTWLVDQLAGLPVTEMMDFQIRLDEVRRRADTFHMWGAAYQICDGLCSDDGFFYFQAWLVGLGRKIFERAVRDPDTLAEVPQLRRLAGRSVDDWDDDEWPEWESLDYVAERAHERVTGVEDGLDDLLEERGHDGMVVPEPVDARWDFEDPAEVTRRFPRLVRMFPLTARADRDRRSQAEFARFLADRGQTEAEFFAEWEGRPGVDRTV